MINNQSSSIQADKATICDRLSFEAYRDTIFEVIREAETPLTIGIFGSWGAGKTSLLLMLQEKLCELKNPIWFNAWQYNQEAALWRVLLGRVLEALRPPENDLSSHDEENLKLNQQIDDLQTALYQDVDRDELGRFEIDWGQLAKGGLKGAVKLALPYFPGAGILADLHQLAGNKANTWTEDVITAFQRQKTRVHIEHIQFLEQFREKFQELVNQYYDRNKVPLVIFIDDLDRCLPDKAIDVLEAIKVFLNAEHCVFVIAVDPKVIVEGIRVKYRDFLIEKGESSEIPITGDDYIEKIIQLPFYLPPVTFDNMIKFIKDGIGDLPDECAQVFARGIEANPRKIKRALNVFRLHKRMSKHRPELGDLQPVRLAKVVAIQSRYPELYRDWVNAPLLVRDLERHLLALQSAVSDEKPTPPGKLVEKWADSIYLHLHQMLLFEAQAQEMGFSDLDQAEVQKYLSLTISSAALPESIGEKNSGRLWNDLLSNDYTRIESAVGRIQESDKSVFSQRLIAVLNDSNSTGIERISAGEALNCLGDPRFDPIAWFLPMDPQFGFYRIPEGTFWMGSDPQRDSFALESEQPQHRINLPDPYYIARYPTTTDQFRAFVKECGYQPASSYSLEGRGNHPASFVTWNDALAYCDWLDSRFRAIDIPSDDLRQLLELGWVVSLPSEAEWERAARGDDGRIYPWGDDREIINKANLDHYSDSIYTTAVGCYPKGNSPFGVADMAGNVWEWTRSRWGPSHDKLDFKYPYDAKDGREGLMIPGARVLRGGSYAEPADRGRCACRSGYLPEAKSGSMGFRVAIVNLKSNVRLSQD